MNTNYTKKNGLVVSTLVAGVLAISGTASAAEQPQAEPTAQANNQQVAAEVNEATAAAAAEVESTLQQKIEDEEGELLATQPGKVAVAEQTTAEVAEEEGADAEDGQQVAVAAVGQQVPAPANIDATPTLAGESGGNIEATPITLQQKVKDNRGELQATQPGQVEVQENRRVRAK